MPTQGKLSINDQVDTIRTHEDKCVVTQTKSWIESWTWLELMSHMPRKFSCSLAADRGRVTYQWRAAFGDPRPPFDGHPTTHLIYCTYTDCGPTR